MIVSATGDSSRRQGVLVITGLRVLTILPCAAAEQFHPRRGLPERGVPPVVSQNSIVRPVCRGSG